MGGGGGPNGIRTRVSATTDHDHRNAHSAFVLRETTSRLSALKTSPIGFANPCDPEAANRSPTAWRLVPCTTKAPLSPWSAKLWYADVGLIKCCPMNSACVVASNWSRRTSALWLVFSITPSVKPVVRPCFRTGISRRPPSTPSIVPIPQIARSKGTAASSSATAASTRFAVRPSMCSEIQRCRLATRALFVPPSAAAGWRIGSPPCPSANPAKT